jgi:hypothetical protein
MKKAECKDCTYWFAYRCEDDKDETFGECRRNPPAGSDGQRDPIVTPLFHWCGEWKQADGQFANYETAADYEDEVKP